MEWPDPRGIGTVIVRAQMTSIGQIGLSDNFAWR